MNPQLLHNDTSPKCMLSNLAELQQLTKFDSKRRLPKGRIKWKRPTRLAAPYSHKNERFSATIWPFAINRHRQAITRPSSK